LGVKRGEEERGGGARQRGAMPNVEKGRRKKEESRKKAGRKEEEMRKKEERKEEEKRKI
jgi:hypothetical protein